jgi:hypothetical protein
MWTMKRCARPGLARARWNSGPPSINSTSRRWRIPAKPGQVKQRAEDLPLDQRLANYIEGTKDGLMGSGSETGRGRDAAGYQRSADGGMAKPVVQQ